MTINSSEQLAQAMYQVWAARTNRLMSNRAERLNWRALEQFEQDVWISVAEFVISEVQQAPITVERV